MLNTARSFRAMFTAPHRLAAQSGLAVLREGGNAIEAMIAAAATIAVVYPHMNGIGGDGFWLIATPGRAPIAIDACGAAGANVSAELYARENLAEIPARGGLAANTVAGTVSGWQTALGLAHAWGGKLPLARLLEDAIHYARRGAPVTLSQSRDTAEAREGCAAAPGFASTFLEAGKVPAAGALLRQPALATTLQVLARDGLDDFYRGDLGHVIAADLARAGSPVTLDDLQRHRAQVVTPLSVSLADGTVFNLPPPTQGLASLLILALFERFAPKEADGFAQVHALVEATKLAFRVRDREIADPAAMTRPAAELLAADAVAALAQEFNPERALPWPEPAPAKGDTVWMGCVDEEGRAVSFIQSIYWEFGSGVVLGDTGILWQNRGSSFSLAADSVRALQPGRRPFHTLNPAFARLADGRALVYGAMGGDGQPQTQAAIFSRVARYGAEPQAAVTAPRWLLGRTWGAAAASLKVEARLGADVIAKLRDAGHNVEVLGDFDALMGHAGMIVRTPTGLLEGAADPRGDGGVAGY